MHLSIALYRLRQLGVESRECDLISSLHTDNYGGDHRPPELSQNLREDSPFLEKAPPWDFSLF